MKKDMAENYLQADVMCPYCGGDNMTSSMMETDTNIAWRDVSCLDCEKGWRDEFTLTAISWFDGPEEDRKYSDEEWPELSKLKS